MRDRKLRLLLPFLLYWFNATPAAATTKIRVAKPLFTHFPTGLVCEDTSFVALAAVKPQELIFIRIGNSGIEPAQRIQVPYDDILGMKCSYSRIELLVEQHGNDHFSRLAFTISDSGVEREEPQEIQYSISGKGPEPLELVEFYHLGRQLRSMLGNWYVHINSTDPKRMYELHFVKTEQPSSRGLIEKLSVTLLQETYRSKILESVPLIQEENIEYAD